MEDGDEVTDLGRVDRHRIAELEVVREAGLSPVWAEEVQRAPRGSWVQRAVDQLGERVYVTVDVDGLDPSVIPGTGFCMK